MYILRFKSYKIIIAFTADTPNAKMKTHQCLGYKQPFGVLSRI